MVQESPPPLFSAKIIYENTIFAKKFRACGVKMKDLAKILENKGVIILWGYYSQYY